MIKSNCLQMILFFMFITEFFMLTSNYLQTVLLYTLTADCLYGNVKL